MNKIVIVVIIIILCFSFGYLVSNNQENRIITFVSSKNEKMVSMDLKQLDLGPFFYMKNAWVYKVVTDKNVYWIRFYFSTQVYRELPNNRYEQLNENL